MDLEAARKAVAGAKRVAVLTGAGISAESGVPTFRSWGGLWRGFSAEDLATPEGFARDPKQVWEWYDWRRSQMAEASPNPGHYALADFAKRSTGFTLITQNVDGLHERAGSPDVLRLHGSIWHTRCLTCAKEEEDRRERIPDLPPKCQSCGGMLRPAVVWFGEVLPPEVFDQALAATLACDVFLVAGTSAAVHPAASLVPLAASSGATVIEVNPEETDVSDVVHHTLRGPSGVILPQLLSPRLG